MDDCTSEIDSTHVYQCFSMVDFTNVACAECRSIPNENVEQCFDGLIGAGVKVRTFLCCILNGAAKTPRNKSYA